MLIVYDYQIFGVQKFGGVSRYFCALASRLDRFAHVKARIVAPLYVNGYLRRLNDGIAVGRHVPRLPKTGRVIRLFNSRLFPLKTARLRPDVVHETYYSEHPTFSRKTACVVTVFDMIHELWPGNFSTADKTAPFKRRAIERADRIICISENTRRDLLNAFQLREERIIVTQLGYDALPPTELSASALVGDAPYLLYVGGRKKYKNFLGLARAFAGSQRLRRNFRIVCFGGGAMSKDERSELSALGLSDGQVVQLSGEDEVLGRLYAGASAFVYPSKYEGFGIPLLEAMSLGCPVIASNTSSIPEVAGDAAEYFDPDDADSITAAIETVMGSEERRKELVALGRTRCKLFSWERCARETLAVYESIVA